MLSIIYLLINFFGAIDTRADIVYSPSCENESETVRYAILDSHDTSHQNNYRNVFTVAIFKSFCFCCLNTFFNHFQGQG